jgi:hypothetical protein
MNGEWWMVDGGWWMVNGEYLLSVRYSPFILLPIDYQLSIINY